MVATANKGTMTQFRQAVMRKITHETIPITKLAIAFPLFLLDAGGYDVCMNVSIEQEN
jgi:hypothetical protein